MLVLKLIVSKDFVDTRHQNLWLFHNDITTVVKGDCIVHAANLQQKSQTAKGLAKLLENYPEDKLPFPRREHHVPELGTLRNPKENLQKSRHFPSEIT